MSPRGALLCYAVSLAMASRLRAPEHATNTLSGSHSKKLNASNASSPRNAAHHTNAAQNLTDAQKVKKLQDGLRSIQRVQALFAGGNSGTRAMGAEKFAEGALTEELSSKDSAIWAVIDAMVNSTQKVAAEMVGKSRDQQKKIMQSLEAELDSKAVVLRNVTNDAGRRQVVQDEEYVLGLLNMHANQWSMGKQLETVKKFMAASPKLTELYKHHNANQSLAMQLAALMDSKVAAHMFLQLADDLQ
ncbi:unnamed protein product [Prorocentrum cordatum]|uniref:Uncharacterized protein n=1 Tax=Prorocentrum cordatum TaxID=2364126 RepID=A0ABN9TLW2_9DINO|nr:unnamed protein product [Polarella glacialis]